MEPVYPPLRVQSLIETQTLRNAVLEAQIAGCQALLLTLAQGGHPRGRRRLPHRDGRRARAPVALIHQAIPR